VPLRLQNPVVGRCSLAAGDASRLVTLCTRFGPGDTNQHRKAILNPCGSFRCPNPGHVCDVPRHPSTMSRDITFDALGRNRTFARGLGIRFGPGPFVQHFLATPRFPAFRGTNAGGCGTAAAPRRSLRSGVRHYRSARSATELLYRPVMNGPITRTWKKGGRTRVCSSARWVPFGGGGRQSTDRAERQHGGGAE